MAEPEFAPRQSDSRACIVKHTAQYCSSQTDQSPFCLCIEATGVLICHLGPVAGKRNHSSILVCRITRRAGRHGPSEIIPSTRLLIRPSRGGSQEATPATSEFQMTLLAAVQGSGNCYSETAPQHPPTSNGYLHQTCLLTAVRFGTLEHCRKTQCFHKCACQH